MTQIVVQDQDVAVISAFLRQTLQDKFPDLDLTDGAALRDLVIGSLAQVTAVIRAEIQTVRLTRNPKYFYLLDDESRDEAILDYLSKFALTPTAGTFSRGVLTLHFRDNSPVTIPGSARFYKTQNLIFRMDIEDDQDLVLDTVDLTPYVALTGEIIDYRYRVPLVATEPGPDYSVAPGIFAGSTRTPPSFMYADTENSFSTAQSTETPVQLLARARDAISTRDLNSAPAIRDTLQEAFPSVSDILVVGHEDAEMKRDLFAPDDFYVGVHTGGATDVYVHTQVVKERVHTATIGDDFQDPRNTITAFKDATIPDWRVVARVGMILRVYNGSPAEPSEYLISRVTRTRLYIDRLQMFPAEYPVVDRDGDVFTDGVCTPTDTLTSVDAAFTSADVGKYVQINGSSQGNDGVFKILSVSTDSVVLDGAIAAEAPGFSFEIFSTVVEYSIGDNTSADNAVSVRRTGEFTRSIQRDGAVLLPQVPVYLIRSVSIYLPSDPNADAVTGNVTFFNQVNREPDNTTSAPLEYQVFNEDPITGNSGDQLLWLDVGPAPEMRGRRGQFVTGIAEFRAADADRAFTGLDIGKLIDVTRASIPSNRGQYEIISYVSPGVVTVSKVGDVGWVAVGEPAAHWELSNKRRFDNQQIRIVYDTLIDFETISAFISGDRRITCSSLLLRGFHMIYISAVIRYRTRPGATASLDDATARRVLLEFLDSYPASQTLTVTDVIQAVQSAYPQVQVVTPLVLSYVLVCPDGRLINYETSDRVTLSRANLTSSNPQDRLEDPKALSVTDRSTRYTSDVALLQFVEVA